MRNRLKLIQLKIERPEIVEETLETDVKFPLWSLMRDLIRTIRAFELSPEEILASVNASEASRKRKQKETPQADGN